MPAVRSRLLVAAITAALLLVGVPAVSGSAGAATKWAPEATAKIKPGVQMYTAGAQCTSNFVFKDKAGNVYVGYAAHCAGKGGSSDTNGCTTGTLPLGTAVSFVKGGNFFSGGTKVGSGRLAYTSWGTMHKLKTKSASRCAYNDFALVKVDKSSRGSVNPTVPKFGGPTGIARPALAAGAPIYTVGNSSLRTGTATAKTGKVISTVGKKLAYELRTGNPGIPGDSGSGFMDGKGRIAGVLSTINLGLGSGVTNTMGNIAAELLFAQKYSGIKGLVLVEGTRGFTK
ncbi:MAG: hypothetical protein JWQ74_230 [Marmoricola sp.]|nr:hypothetical protein [Marmoricola sp.]